MERIVIVDYGSGNLHSAAKAFERAARECGREAVIAVTARPEEVQKADRVVLPGVGAFAACKRGLAAVDGLLDALDEAVRRRGRPFLGICVGMQLLATRGLEFETTPGLDWIAGEVRAIDPAPGLKIPHMGWNTLAAVRDHPLLTGLGSAPDGPHAYFVHSYHFVLQDRAALLASTDYGGPLAAVIATGNIAGTQFHPEKSQALGLKLIANFLAWQP